MSQGGFFLLSLFMRMYLQLLVALILAIFMMVVGKPHASWCAPLAPNCDFMFHLMRRCCGRKQVASSALVTFDFEAGQGGIA